MPKQLTQAALKKFVLDQVGHVGDDVMHEVSSRLHGGRASSRSRSRSRRGSMHGGLSLGEVAQVARSGSKRYLRPLLGAVNSPYARQAEHVLDAVGAGYIGGLDLGDVARSVSRGVSRARAASKKYVRPVLGAIDSPYARRAERVLDAVGGVYIGGARSRVVGTREDVWNGLAERTSGGLTKADLTVNKRGKVVSKRASAAARARDSIANLQ